MAEAATRHWAGVAGRVFVSVGMLGLLLWWLPTQTLLQAFGRIDAPLWVLVLVGFAAGHAVAALKWRMLVRASGLAASVLEIFRAHGAGLFANLCLPSLVGGDLLRAGLLVRRHGRAEAAAVAGLADRLLDTAGLLALAALGTAALSGSGGDRAARVWLAAGAMLALLGLAAWLGPRMHWPVPARLVPIADKLRAALEDLVAQPRVAVAALALSLAIQSGFVLLNVALGRAVGIDLPLAAWFFAWPLAKLVALLPVSLGGIGVREGALAALLAPFGVAPALAVAQSLLWETVLIALGLVAGGASLWIGRSLGDAAPAALRDPR